MTATPSIDPAEFLHEQLAQASPDLMRDLLTTFVNALLSADADAVCGAAYNARSPERVGGRERVSRAVRDARAVRRPRSAARAVPQVVGRSGR